MPVKIRLSKKGRKKLPFYHIVVADSRAPRDGKFVERIGLYNPQTNPATIELNFDRALDWLQKGAQPTDTCRAILSEQGVLIKKHLLEGVKKGAFDETEAEARFQKWLNEKEAKIQAVRDKITKGKTDEAKKRLAAETKVKEAKAEELAKKLKAQAQQEKAEAVAAEESAEEVVKEEAVTEVAEEPVAEKTAEPVAKKEEEPVAEKAEEAAEEKTEEPVVEKTEEPKAEETEKPSDSAEA